MSKFWIYTEKFRHMSKVVCVNLYGQSVLWDNYYVILLLSKKFDRIFQIGGEKVCLCLQLKGSVGRVNRFAAMFWAHRQISSHTPNFWAHTEIFRYTPKVVCANWL